MAQQQLAKRSATEPKHMPDINLQSVLPDNNKSIESTEIADRLNIKQSGTIGFSGLDDADETTYPTGVDGHERFGSPRSFLNAVEQLPEARSVPALAANPLITGSDEPRYNSVQDVLNTPLDDLPVDLSTPHSVSRYDQLNNHKLIVHPQLLALRALGFSTNYVWNVVTNRYSIINPSDALHPAYRTFKDNGASNVFGAIHWDTFGGHATVNIYFPNYVAPNPAVVDLDSEDEIDPSALDPDERIYIGIQCELDHTSTSPLKIRTVGYDANLDREINYIGGGALFNKNSRRHAGKPTDATHERRNGRVPISEWWDNKYNELSVVTDTLIDDILVAVTTTIDFSSDSIDYSLSDFYSYLGIPDSYIHGTDGVSTSIIQRCQRYSINGTEFSAWALFHALTKTLLSEFQGSRTGTTYKRYATTASDILRSPAKVIRRVEREHAVAQQLDDQSSGAGVDIPDPDDIELDKLDAVTTGETSLTLEDHRQNIQQTLNELSPDN